jgi:T-complex protein 1 subunit alpha
VRRVDRADLRRLAKVTGARVQLTLADLDGGESFDKSSLGYADVVEETRVGDNDFIFVRGSEGRGATEVMGENCDVAAFDPPARVIPDHAAKASTILLRGANEYMLEETERSIHDALMAVSKTCESQFVVPGGGAVETALSLHLEDFANGATESAQGKEIDAKTSKAIEAFSEALLTIPTVLTCNAALDAIDLTSKLSVVHEESRKFRRDGTVSDKLKTGADPSKKKYFGLNLTDNKIHNSIEAGVLEPMISKLKSLKFATEATITILRIDDLIKLAPEEQEGR